MAAARQRSRRWDVSPEEMERMAAARRRPLGPLVVARLLARSPRLIPEVVRAVAGAARQALFANNALVSVLDGELARQAVPDAATGVGWYDEDPFLAVLLPRLRAEMNVLELGCGGGRLSRHVGTRVAGLVCTDPSRAMVAEAAANLAGQHNVRVACTDGFSLCEFPAGAFDAVFAQGVLGYLAPNPLLALLDEVHRVLRAEGLCVFNFFTIDDPEDAGRQVALVRKAALARRFGGAVDQTYTLSQLHAMYAATGLRVEQSTEQHRSGPDGSTEGSGRVIVVARA